MKNKIITELEKFKARLDILPDEDEKAAYEIKTDLFIFIKSLGEFDEYLQAINEVKFSHENMIFNSGNINKINKFRDGRQNLLRSISHIEKELQFKKIVSKILPKPETISVSWFIKNFSFQSLSFAAMALIVAFVLGAVSEHKYGTGKTIAPWLLSPIQQIQATLSEQTVPQERDTKTQEQHTKK